MKAIIGHIILNVQNYKESETFYDCLMKELGFKIEHTDAGDWGKMKSYRQGDHNLWIRFDAQKESQEFVRDVGLDHLAFEVHTQQEVDIIFKLIQTLNVKITRTPRLYPEYTNTYYAFFFRDPNGIPLEVFLQ